MAVEVDDGYWSVGAIDRAEERKCDCVVASEGDQTWEGLSLERWAGLVGICRGLAGKEVVMPVLNLLKRIRVIIANCELSINSMFEMCKPTRSLEYHHNQ